MTEEEFAKLKRGDVILDTEGEEYEVVRQHNSIPGSPVLYEVESILKRTVAASTPMEWSLPPKHTPKARMLKVTEDIPVPRVATSYTNTFMVPTEVDGDLLVIDNKGRRMVVEPDGGEVVGGDGDFSVTLFSACNELPKKKPGAHAFMKSMMGKRVRVTVEVLD